MKTNLKKMPAGEFKAKCLQLMDLVKEQHVPIIITKHGVPVAKLVPADEEGSEGKRLFGRLKGSVIIKSDIISPIDEGWDADE